MYRSSTWYHDRLWRINTCTGCPKQIIFTNKEAAHWLCEVDCCWSFEGVFGLLCRQLSSNANFFQSFSPLSCLGCLERDWDRDWDLRSLPFGFYCMFNVPRHFPARGNFEKHYDVKSHFWMSLSSRQRLLKVMIDCQSKSIPSNLSIPSCMRLYAEIRVSYFHRKISCFHCWSTGVKIDGWRNY
jgi:hypothetical protein